MKMKKKAAIAAAVFAVTMNLSACAYGPPTEELRETYRNEEDTSYDPAENQMPGVYGPPEEEYEDTTRTDSETSYDPAENINADVYGPPID